ncbi:MAG: AAA family ATPase [Planctomycetota bacterium]
MLPYQRIHVTGNAGSGKTTLARELAKELDLPFVSLDSVVWRPGWKPAPSVELREDLNKIAAEPRWVIDGVSKTIRDAADIVIYLEVSRRRCAWRCARRNLPYLFRSRPELPAGCPEWASTGLLARIIWKFPNTVGVRLVEQSQSDQRYRVVRNTDDLERVKRELTAGDSGGSSTS